MAIKVFFVSRRNYFQLDAEKLSPGDIILSTSFEKSSLLIRLLDCSPYSHAALYIGDNQYAEAVGLGIRVRSISTILQKRIKVIRLKNSENNETLKIANKAVDCANKYLHLPYWIKGVLLIKFLRVNNDSQRNYFCSHFVAQCYYDAGIRFAGNCKPEKISPKDLAESCVFYDISEYAVKRATSIPKHLVLGKFTTLSDVETKMYQVMYDYLLPLYKKKTNYNYVPIDWQELITHIIALCINEPREKNFFDTQIIQIMKKSGFLNLNELAVEAVIKPMEAFYASIQHTTLPKTLKEAEINKLNTGLKAMQATLKITKENKSRYKKLFTKTQMQTFMHLKEYHIKLIRNYNRMIFLTQKSLSTLSVI
jgi:hypothetical protein